ncbi:hypothetical protein AURDEDRAFT_171711 [Auricularia subglabra TFB-10046 SS5]|nr:hypothetical protein AURDEDRAFT_171711 [Auricularia subglabra TFB-10046 SS5]
MPAGDTGSKASTATQVSVSHNRVLRWEELEDGMLGLADHSIKHAVVQALTSVIPPSSLAPTSLLRKDLESLGQNCGRFRPFIVVHKPRGRQAPGRIVLMTHFDMRPVQELDECSQALAVALGTVTPPWPTETSRRIQIEPEWTDKNSYALAFTIRLEPGRHPKRYHTAPKGTEYKVGEEELEVLRDLCKDRAEALAGMSREQLNVLLQSYETHVATYRPSSLSYRGSVVTAAQSQASVLPSIREDSPAEAPPPAANAADTPEVDCQGHRRYHSPDEGSRGRRGRRARDR